MPPCPKVCVQQGFESVFSEAGEREAQEVAKFRLVDDFSELCHNDAAIVHETISTDGVDCVAGACKAWSIASRSAEASRQRPCPQTGLSILKIFFWWGIYKL